MNRRDLLKQMASAGLLLPFAQNLISPAFAAGAAGKKLIMIYYPSGTVASAWSNTSQDSWMQEPLKPYQSKIVSFTGLTLSGIANGHREVRGDEGALGNKLWCGLLSGGNLDSCVNAGSIDYQIAKALGQEPINVGIGVRGITGNVRTENQITSTDQQSNGKHTYVVPIDDPQKAFDVYVGTGDNVTKDPKIQMLETVQKDFSLLQAKALSVAEKTKVDAYAQTLTDLKASIEANLSNSTSGSSFSRPSATLADALAQSTGQGVAARAHMDTIVAALSQGKQRVASFSFGVYSDSESQDACFLINSQEARDMHKGKFGSANYENARHGASHNDQQSSQTHIRWILTQVAYLLDKLQKASLLDSTLVVLTTDVHDGTIHTSTDMPWLIAGGVSGRVVDCGGKNHRALLTGVAQAMGLGWSKYGDSDGVLSVL